MLRRLARTPTGLVAGIFVLLLLLTAIFAPVFLSDRATEGDVFESYASPSWEHPIGTDGLGRDLLARLLVATRLTLKLAIGAVAISAGLGILLGVVAAQLRPRARNVALRFIDMMVAFPGLILAIYVGTIIGPGELGLVLGVGLAGCFNYARLTSTLALVIGGRDYIKAARVSGVRGRRLLMRYVLPNASETLIVATTVSLTSAIVALSGLSFLGLGVQPPDFDWGSMLTEGVDSIYLVPAGAAGPAIVIAISALSFGFLGEALARASNPLAASGTEPLARVGAPSPSRRMARRADSAAGPGTEADAVTVEGLSIVFPDNKGEIEIIRDVSFRIRQGERVGLVGESGSGKSMTALALAHLTPFPGRAEGVITHRGVDVSALTPARRQRVLAAEVAVVFQDPMSSINPAMRIGTQLTEGIRRHGGATPDAARERAIERLREVHMGAPEEQLGRHPHELSGGMRQRTMIAMGLMMEPTLLIADEPTTALDVTIQAQIMDLLQEISRERQAALLLISHNLALVKQNTDRLLVMYAGRIVEELPSDRLDEARHPYTKALLAAVPDLDQDPAQLLAEIPGQAPDPRNRPSGCPFHPRCPLAEDRCRADEPVLMRLSDDKQVACWVTARVPA